MWHCPHCGAPQAESARCWVCRRSSTTCSTCRHFRTSLAADVGYCGRDRARAPLTGLELRPCWEEGIRSRPSQAAGLAPDVEVPGAAADARGRRAAVTVRGSGGPFDRPDPLRLRGFVPLDELTDAPVQPSDGQASSDPPPLPPAILTDVADWASRTSLFGEPEG